jgi:hypothetical protein
MPKEFRIEHEGALPARPEQVFAAVTEAMGAWLMPSEPMRNTAVVWEPPHRCVSREQDGEWFNQLEFTISEHESGAYIRYVHSGIFVDDWENQYDAARRHTLFYMHTLGQYLAYFQGRPYRHVEVLAPPSSLRADGLAPARRALGLPDGDPVGAELTVDLPAVGPTKATVDFANDTFLGLRTDDALYRFFGRNRFGWPAAVGVYQYGEQAVPLADVEAAWSRWLGEAYGA